MKALYLPGPWVLALAVLFGCTQSVQQIDPETLAAHRERLILPSEPDGVVGVVQAREMLTRPTVAAGGSGQAGSPEAADASAASPPSPAPGEVASPQSVVVVGRIGGIPNPWKQARPDYPWKKGQAEFVIADAAAAIEVADHGHAHDDPDHDCPFCAAAADSGVVALVRFKDETGKVIPIDAKRLFDLRGEETVVVRGKAEILGDAKDGVLIVDADGLYVRQL